MTALSGRDPARVLKRRGRTLMRIRGSHHVCGRRRAGGFHRPDDLQRSGNIPNAETAESTENGWMCSVSCPSLSERSAISALRSFTCGREQGFGKK